MLHLLFFGQFESNYVHINPILSLIFFVYHCYLHDKRRNKKQCESEYNHLFKHNSNQHDDSLLSLSYRLLQRELIDHEWEPNVPAVYRFFYQDWEAADEGINMAYHYSQSMIQITQKIISVGDKLINVQF
jgi:hypothetical protein